MTRYLSSHSLILAIGFITPQLFERAFDLYVKYQDKAWGLTDCVSFVVMREAGITQALTSDQHFQQAGFEAMMADDRV